MLEERYRVVHGSVEDIVKADDPAGGGSHRLQLRQEEGGVLSLGMDLPANPIRIGNALSVVVERARPNRVLALVDHTTGEGCNTFHDDRPWWPSRNDALIIAVAACAFAIVLGWLAVPALMLFVVVYWFVTRRMPEVRRQRSAAHVAYLLDREYFYWRATVDWKEGAR